MLSPLAVNETGLGTFPSDTTALTNLINQSGLNVPFVTGSTDFDSYFAPPNSNFSKNRDGTKWQSDFSNVPFGGTVDFDLGNNLPGKQGRYLEHLREESHRDDFRGSNRALAGCRKIFAD